MTRAVLALLLLMGCTAPLPPGAAPDAGARVGYGDLADAGTTAVGLAAGFTEANPALAWAGPATPLVMLGAKYALKDALIKSGGDPAEVNLTVESVSMGAACANVAILASAVPVAAAAGALACGIAYYEYSREDTTK